MHVIGTAGHVDHGKSTLVLALTGMDPDRFEEEKRRGLTIDLGFAWCTLPSGREIGIVDVPGHERFIRNMLAGVGSIDAALFVVAADEGWMPQSAEHLQILDFLGVDRGVVAITKADVVDEEMVHLVEAQVRERLAPTPLAAAPIIPVSAPKDVGLDELRSAIDDVLPAPGRQPDTGRPRMFVDRSFTIAGAGTVVTGTLTRGELAVGDEVRILPDGLRARVRSLQTHRTSVERAVPSSRVAMNLVGLERSAVRRGDVLVGESWLLTDRFAARLRAATGLAHPLKERSAYELAVGSAQTPCRIKLIEAVTELGAGSATLVEVFADMKLPLVPGDRFVVRDVGRWETVAGGVVIDSAPPKLRRGDVAAVERLSAREHLSGAALAAQIVAERGTVDRTELAMLVGEHAPPEGDIESTPTHYFSRETWLALESSAADAVARYHTNHPLAPGKPIEELRIELGLDPHALTDLLSAWQGRGLLVREGAVVRLAQHGAALTAEQRSVADRALQQLRGQGPSPSPFADVGLSHELAKALERAGELVLVTPAIAYAADTWADVERKVVALITSTGAVTVAQVRDAVGTSRKYAVPLLEKLDATGVTRRSGDVRDLGPRGRDLSGA